MKRSPCGTNAKRSSTNQHCMDCCATILGPVTGSVLLGKLSTHNNTDSSGLGRELAVGQAFRELLASLRVTNDDETILARVHGGRRAHCTVQDDVHLLIFNSALRIVLAHTPSGLNCIKGLCQVSHLLSKSLQDKHSINSTDQLPKDEMKCALAEAQENLHGKG